MKSKLNLIATSGILLLTTSLVIISEPVEGSFTFYNFSNTNNLTLVENAIQYNNTLRLTAAFDYEKGAAWYEEKVNVDTPFSTSFSFRISELDPELHGGDGFAFVIQNYQSNSISQYAGSTIGYGSDYGYPGISNSVAIEFDTWYSDIFNDPNGNHISIQTRGANDNSVNHLYSLGQTTMIPDISDGNIHNVKIDYRDERFFIFLDDMISPRLIADANLQAILSLDHGMSWVGFTASTGAANENHDILSWSFMTIPEPSTINVIAIWLIVSISLIRKKNY